MIKKIDHINISVTNLAEATKFFTDLLNFKIEQQGVLKGDWIDKVVGLKNVNATYTRLYIPNAETYLELIQYQNPTGQKDPQTSQANQIGFRHMAFEVTGIEEICKKLKDAGVKFFSELETYNNKKKLCYFLGPDGVILELAEYE